MRSWLNEYEKDEMKERRQAHNKHKEAWTIAKPAFCTWLLANITESSKKRNKEQSNALWDKAKEEDNIVAIFKLSISSHNFYGQVASLREQKDVRHQHDFFMWISPEVLQQFKLRWDDMIKEAIRVGIDKDLTPTNRFYHFTNALTKYGHSSLIRQQSMIKVAEIDVNPDYSIADFYEAIVRISRVDRYRWV